jgi:Domain of unknown function (DUF4338)
MAKQYGRRDFSAELVQRIADIIERHPGMKRTPLSRKVCEELDWRGTDGRLCEMACRVTLLRLHADGLISLPPSQIRQPRRRASFEATPATDPQSGIDAAVHELAPLSVRIVQGRGEESRLWNEFMARYHYLGYTPMSGQQLRYSVYAGEQLVALLGFGAAAWKLADRERFVGWNDEQRRSRLHRVVNNTRFLILPWVQCRGLASKVLGMVARRLPADWQQRYGFTPVMLETFVESPRHKGTCYQAANWQRVGRTTGRGKTSTSHAAQLPIKDVWLYPLRRDFRSVLAGA